jgi:hypothetical protein
MEYAYHYSKFPALRAYIDRVGAEQINHKRFQIREYRDQERARGYYTIHATITIKGGEISCDVEEYAPTEEEKASIELEIASVEWPKSVGASEAHAEQLRAELAAQHESTLHVIYDVSRKQIIMCRERIDHEDRSKTFKPWTMFIGKGGQATWRQMEPDGDALPFWKPRERRQKTASVMVHEGEKAAEFCDRLVNDPEWKERRKAHPWIAELTRFEHWGTLTGAPATHRCDFEELRKMNIESMVVYSCDNDNQGVSAARTFSKHYGRAMYMITYDKQFPQGWDLADPVPEKLLNKNGRAKRTLLSMMKPATWATVPLPKQKGERQGYALNRQFGDQWLFSVKPLRFHHVWLPLRSFDSSEFDALVRPFSDVRQTSQSVIKEPHSQGVCEIYDPHRPSGLCHDDDGVSFVNTHIPSTVKDFPDGEKLDPKFAEPIEDFFEQLIPNELERHEVKLWCATIMHERSKLHYALLIVSETQGVGKTTLADIIWTVLGRENGTAIQASTLIDSGYQYWGEKQLVIINEIHEGHQTKIVDRLKEVITDKTVNVHKKWQKPYDAPNHINIFACSNHLRALHILKEDRRWLVARASERKRTEEYWLWFNDWLENEDGYRKFKRWAKDFVKEHGSVTKAKEAPKTEARMATIVEGFRESTRYLFKAFEWIVKVHQSNCETVFNERTESVTIDGIEFTVKNAAKKVVEHAKNNVEMIILNKDAERAIKDRFYQDSHQRWEEKARAERAAMITAAKSAGLHVSEKRITVRGWYRGFQATILSPSRELAEMDPNDLARAAAATEEEGPFELTLRGKRVKVAVVEIGVLAEDAEDW